VWFTAHLLSDTAVQFAVAQSNIHAILVVLHPVPAHQFTAAQSNTHAILVVWHLVAAHQYIAVQ